MPRSNKGGKVQKGGKTSKKKAAKKKASKQKVKFDPKDRRDRVYKAVKIMSKSLKGNGKIVTGAQVEDLDFRKEPTGIAAYDYVFNGGLIRGAASNMWGPDGAAKTSAAAKIARNFQARGFAVALGAIENFDKAWWRRAGTYITYSDQEIAALPSTEERRKAKAYNAYYDKKGWVPLTLLVHKDGVRVLDFVVASSRTGAFDLVIVDSLGAVVGHGVEEEESVGDAKYGGNSKEMGRFSSFITSTFNYRFDADGTYNPSGDHDNQTIVLCLNQVRSTIGSMARAMHKQLHPPGGWALRHLWSQQVFQHGTEEMSGYLNIDSRRVRDVYARTFRLVGTKMRGGPPERHAEFDFYLKKFQDEWGRIWRPGDVDTWKSLRQMCTVLGVFDTRGANIYFDGKMWKGKISCENALRDQVLYDELYAAMIEAARREALTGSVPEVG